MKKNDFRNNLESIGNRAEDFYENNLRATLETDENIGKLLLIDTDRNRYVVTSKEDERQKFTDLNAAQPGHVYVMRIGYPAVRGIGNTIRPWREMPLETRERARRDRSRQAEMRT